MAAKDTQNNDFIRILLVDDEINFLNVLTKRLTRRNFIVTTANNGDQAIQALRSNDFDIVVLDLKMEGMDGIEVLKIFKKMVPDLPVIMLTGHGSQIAAEEGLKHGVLDYLSKPYEFENLIKKIYFSLNKEFKNGK